MKKANLRRAEQLKFIRDDKSEFVIPAPTVAQIRQCMELEPESAETVESPLARAQRIVEQVTILTGDRSLVDSLTYHECGQIYRAVIAHVHGFDPNDILQLERLKKKAPASRSELMAQLDEICFAVAVNTHRDLAAIDAMPIVDVLSLNNAAIAAENRRARFDAALHDKKLEQ